MTATLASRSPAAGAQSVGQRPHVIVSLAGEILDPVVLVDVNIFVDGVPAVASGVAAAGFEMSVVANAAFGIDVTVRPLNPLTSDAWHSARVLVRDLDVGWSFRVLEARGPYIFALTPAMDSNNNIQLPLVEFDIVDDTHGVQKRVQIAESDLGERSGSQLTVPDMDLRGSLGSVVEVNGTPAFVTAEIGPHIVTTSVSGGGSAMNVKLFARAGIDVTIAGAKVIQSGEVVTGLGWTTVLTEPNPGVWHVSAQKTGSNIALGTRVEIHVRAQDANADHRNISDLGAFFYVGDRLGPNVGNVAPIPGSRGLSTVAATTQPVIDIVDDPSGVTQASIQVTVGGAAAITNGVGVGDFSGSTVNAITDGFRVTLIKGTAWPSDTEVGVLVEATDTLGNVMPQHNWLYHFGATTQTFAADVTAGDNIRTVSFDYANTSFARPVDLKHTGFAWDGFWYEKGAKTTTRASWATEASGANRATRDEFPVSGFVSVRAAGWDLLDSSAVMWMKCARLGSGTIVNWSQAGSLGQSIRDVAMASDRPVMFLAVDNTFIVVDFTADRAWRIDAGGRQLGLIGGIATRNGDQSGGAFEIEYALYDAPTVFACVDGLAWDGNWIVAGARLSQIEFSGVLPDYAAASAAARGTGGNFAAHAVRLVLPEAVLGTFARVRLARRGPSKIEPACVLFTDGDGLSHVAIVDWLGTFAWLQGPRAIYAWVSEPARDLDQTFDEDGKWILALATTLRVALAELAQDASSMNLYVTLTPTDLTLNTVASSTVSAAALGAGFQRATGYLYAACAAASDGKAVRYRHQPVTASPTGKIATLASGTPVRSLAPLGTSRLFESRFINASMVLNASGEQFIRASMVVE